MIYGLIPFFFIPVFLAWLLYRLLIKKDIQKYRYEAIAGGVFIGIWTLLFFAFTYIA